MLPFLLLLSTVLAGAWAWRLWREIRGGIASFAGGAEVERATSPVSYWIAVGGGCAVLLVWLVVIAVLAGAVFFGASTPAEPPPA